MGSKTKDRIAAASRAAGRALATALVVALAPSGAACAGEPWEFWPEVNAFVGLTPETRLHFVAAYARDKDSYNQTLDAGGYFDVAVKPPMRRSLRQEDWVRNRYLWARVGYVHVFKAEGGVPSPAEDRGIVSVYGRLYPPLEIVVETRMRADLRWIEGDYSTRYRLRGEMNREFRLFEHPVTPYFNAEWFYDTRYDAWSRALFQAGTEVTLNQRLRFELYLARQQDQLPRVSTLNSFGVLAKLYY